jgi:peptidoglycan hydrolase CwlO-like protein
MSFQVIHNRTPKEKMRKTEESIAWLKEQKVWPDLDSINNTLLEVQNLLHRLDQTIHQEGQLHTDISKLTGHIKTLIETIKL